MAAHAEDLPPVVGSYAFALGRCKECELSWQSLGKVTNGSGFCEKLKRTLEGFHDTLVYNLL